MASARKAKEPVASVWSQELRRRPSVRFFGTELAFMPFGIKRKNLPESEMPRDPRLRLRFLLCELLLGPAAAMDWSGFAPVPRSSCRRRFCWMRLAMRKTLYLVVSAMVLLYYCYAFVPNCALPASLLPLTCHALWSDSAVEAPPPGPGCSSRRSPRALTGTEVRSSRPCPLMRSAGRTPSPSVGGSPSAWGRASTAF